MYCFFTWFPGNTVKFIGRNNVVFFRGNNTRCHRKTKTKTKGVQTKENGKRNENPDVRTVYIYIFVCSRLAKLVKKCRIKYYGKGGEKRYKT